MGCERWGLGGFMLDNVVMVGIEILIVSLVVVEVSDICVDFELFMIEQMELLDIIIEMRSESMSIIVGLEEDVVVFVEVFGFFMVVVLFVWNLVV